MSDGTTIEWTHRPGTIPSTMNALVGCQKVSRGCQHCYAIEVAHIRAGNPLPVLQDKFGGTTRSEGGKRLWTGKVTLTEKALLDPLKKKKPRTYFVNSLSDLFYEEVPDEWVFRHFEVFSKCPQHTFIVLTKRPERMKEFMLETAGHNGEHLYDRYLWGMKGFTWPLQNVWLGTSCEDQKTADERIPHLLQTPAAIRFISAEPMVGPIDLRSYVGGPWECYQCKCRANVIGRCKGYCQDPTGKSCDATPCPRCGKFHYWGGGTPKGLDWVIAGGESGKDAAPMHPDWTRAVRDQCAAAKVPFFFKQWGEWVPSPSRDPLGTLHNGYMAPDGGRGNLPSPGNGFCHSPKKLEELGCAFVARVGKKKAGHLLDGKVHQEFPEVR